MSGLSASMRARAVPLVCIVSAILIWSILPLLLEHFTDRVGPLAVNASRYVFAALIFLPSNLAVMRRMGREERIRLWRAAALPTAAYVGTQFFYGTAPYFNNATMLNFGCRLSIPFTALFGFCLVPGERRLAGSKRFWTGLAVAFAGFLLMFESGFGTDSTSPMGMWMILGYAAGWGLYVAAVSRNLSRWPPYVSFGVISTMACPLHVVLMLAFGDVRPLWSLGGGDWVLLFVTALFGLALATVLFYRAMEALGPVTSDSSMLLLPFLTGLAAHIFLGESLSPTQWLAGAVLLTGCTLLIAARFRSVPPPEGTARAGGDAAPGKG